MLHSHQIPYHKISVPKRKNVHAILLEGRVDKSRSQQYLVYDPIFITHTHDTK